MKERVFAMIAKYTNGRMFSTYSSYQIQEGRSDRWRLQTNLKGTYYPTVTLHKRGGTWQEHSDQPLDNSEKQTWMFRYNQGV